MPINESLKKILVLGSGAIKIGEAGEFDYSGSQCLKAIHEDGLKSVLINPNIATIQTDTRFADQVYLLPVTPDYVESIIEKTLEFYKNIMSKSLELRYKASKILKIGSYSRIK